MEFLGGVLSDALEDVGEPGEKLSLLLILLNDSLRLSSSLLGPVLGVLQTRPTWR